ncbi:hypothetical protein [Macrococcoides canis]|uniref:hypothetical protein n=1 Tax=Macrococcoides canis TaxID=1855823 RepID=UPI00207C3729|nr:hypothetical protein [Macrococcus canis]
MDNNFLMYQTEDGKTKIDIRLEDETVWMTQKSMAELYQKGVPTINEHIKNIFEEGELLEKRTIRKNRIVQSEGNREVERAQVIDIPNIRPITIPVIPRVW